jgi:hypothetical protein
MAFVDMDMDMNLLHPKMGPSVDVKFDVVCDLLKPEDCKLEPVFNKC